MTCPTEAARSSTFRCTDVAMLNAGPSKSPLFEIERVEASTLARATSLTKT